MYRKHENTPKNYLTKMSNKGKAKNQQQIVADIENEAHIIRLHINKEKAKQMIWQTVRSETVDNFKYLDAAVKNNNDTGIDIAHNSKRQQSMTYVHMYIDTKS